MYQIVFLTLAVVKWMSWHLLIAGFLLWHWQWSSISLDMFQYFRVPLGCISSPGWTFCIDYGLDMVFNASEWLLAVWYGSSPRRTFVQCVMFGYSFKRTCLSVFLVFLQECETMIWEVHYYQQIAGHFDGENGDNTTEVFLLHSTYTNWSLLYVSRYIKLFSSQ
jgi:hypothetical protein